VSATSTRRATVPEEFERRLGNLLRKTAAGEMFGNWNDGGRLE
jgi:hypothetical protein